MIQGIDVSHFQGSPDWYAVASSGKNFAFCKATQGVTYEDPMFSTNWHGIQQAGMIRGAYHFYVPTDDPIAQADHFLQVVGPLGTADLPAVLDLEGQNTLSVEAFQADVLQWLQEVENASGKKPIIYTNTPFGNEWLNNPQFADYPLWVAQYTSRPSPNLPTTWEGKAWTFWQYTDSDTVNGIDGHVDGDRFNGSLAELETFASSGQLTA